MSLKSNSFVAGQNKYVFSLFLNTDNDETDSRRQQRVVWRIGCAVSSWLRSVWRRGTHVLSPYFVRYFAQIFHELLHLAAHVSTQEALLNRRQTARRDLSVKILSITVQHVHPYIGPFSRTTRVSRYHKGKTNLDLTEARDSEWQWQQLGHMQVCTSFQTDNHAITPPLSFFTVPMLFRPPNQQRQSTEGKAITVQQCRNNLYNKSRTNRRNGVRRLESTNVHV